MYRVAAAYEASRPTPTAPEVSVVSTPVLVAYDDVVARYDPVLGLEVHVELNTHTKMFCGCATDVRRRAQHPGLPDVPRPARLAAGGEPHGRGVGDADRAGAQLRDRALVPVRPQELLLPGHAEELPDVAVRRADRLRRLPGRHAGRRHGRARGIERAHMEEDTGKSLHVGGATGRIHGAEYSLLDYNRAGVPLIEIVTKMIPGTGARAPEVARAYVTALRDLIKSLGVSDVRMDQGSMRCDVNLSLSPSPDAAARHPHRDQERQLAALGGAGGALRDDPPGRRARRAASRSCRRPGTSHEDTGTTRSGRRKETGRGLPLLPRARPGADRAGPAQWVERAAGHAARAAVRRGGARLQAEWGAHRRRAARPGQRRRARPRRGHGRRRRARRRRPQVVGGRAGAAGQRARGRAGGAADHAGAGGPGDRAGRRGRAQRQAGPPGRRRRAGRRGRRPTRSSPPAGSRSSPTTGALVAAVDEALAAQPDVAEKIRGGKVAAAGAIVGAVMKATRGQADAAGARAGAGALLRRAPSALAGGRTPATRLGSTGRGGRPGSSAPPPPPPTWMRITRSSLETGLPPFLFTVPSHRKPSGPMAAGPSRP